MKYVKYGIIAIFIISLIIYVGNWQYQRTHTDDTAPEIIIADNAQQIEVSVEADQDELLQGVTARDEKDGDITSSIVVESISKFVDKKNHICNITYAVADSDGHVTKATRKIKYTDYKSPRFVLKQALCFDTGSDISAQDVIGATDVIDGDISNKVKILSKDVSTNVSGDNTITAQVTNSRGDTVTLKSIVIIKQENNLSPKIKLSKNIEYLNIGDKFEPEKYISSVEDSEGNSISKSNVQITSSSVKTKKAGCYMVEYTVKDEEGNVGLAYLTVMVEE